MVKRVKLTKERLKLIPNSKRLEGMKSEHGLWNRKINSQFSGCPMLGRRIALYMPGYMYYFDIGSKFDLIGVRHPDGACMVIPDFALNEADFEEGIFRVDWHKKRARKCITSLETKKAKKPLKREKLNGRVRTKIRGSN